ncbi:DUF397 domain-containing protein [Actinomadura parmotrematis]|uniref:DUF397 domain-containing protein n=1 Tax=Actinomadura parmotrematis TaxID=2864039 RepID=A0ABS7G110_9ACTN|nr:DUF397 domain-containing protein [Actinomadura parmotrematis]MBW8485333.1 DUF397 domain-containing protein [Actinomadura parmotrematis]
MDLIEPVWRKASRSSDQGDNCVELASARDAVAVRDSKDATGPHLLVNRAAFQRFTDAIKNL